MLYWATVFLVAFLWTFGIGLQTKAVVRSHYLPAALMGCVQIFIVRAAVYPHPWLFFVIGRLAYALGNMSSIWVFSTGWPGRYRPDAAHQRPGAVAYTVT